MGDEITFIQGIRVGHYTDPEAATGCTVLLCESGAVAGVDVRGSAPGTRETDLLRPMNLVDKVHAILLSGGSAFGLDAAAGVMRYLGERGVGYDTLSGKVPIVPAAILFDLDIGDSKVRPGPEEGYMACLNASDSEITEGCVGAGTGATVGKLLGPQQATKSGLGIASEKISSDVVVTTIVAVNAFGDIIDPTTGNVLAGTRRHDGKGFVNTAQLLTKQDIESRNEAPNNTTIGIVITNANLNKEQINKVAQMAHDGIARSIDPCHTMYDGDTIFTLSLGQETSDINVIGTSAAHVVSKAIIRAVKSADTLAGIPAECDIV
jgi:L-aminopeptidase/D-esterase-like protein